MAHLRCDFRSEAMDMNTSMTVILPEGVRQSEVPVVYLLHGLADNCTGWSRYTSVERYAREKGAALVIPEVQRSFYADMEQGISYFTFIHDELPEICRNFFGFSPAREKNYLMGLSMGGYGTLKCVLRSPERYAGAAAFSAVADIAQYADALFDANVRFAEGLREKGADVRFEHWQGIHNWVFWDTAVSKAMDYLLGNL